MSGFWCLLKKELRTCFCSPVAFVVMFFFWVLTGGNFCWLLSQLAEGEPLTKATEWMFGGPLLSFALPVVVPLITMRLVAEERKQGTMEALLTTPIRVSQFVLAKFAGAMVFYFVLWLPVLVYGAMARSLPGVESFPDSGALAIGFLGVMLVGCLYVAVGLLMSCLTSNQIIAAIGSFAVLFGSTLSLTLLAYNSQNPVWHVVGEYYSSFKHMMDFSRGVVDSRMVLMYVCNSAWILFVSVKVLEAKRG